MRQWREDGFTRPAPVDQRTALELDRVLFEQAHAFEAIELSPLAPLASCAAMGPTSQNKVVSALRGTEVVADPTNVLALEAAQRLRRDPGAIVRLATSHRCVRAQPVPPRSGFARHFRLFCLASAAIEQVDHGFVISALAEHVTTHVAAIDRLESLGYTIPPRQVSVLASARRAELGDRLAERLQPLAVTRAELTHSYYDGLRFRVDIADGFGADVPLVDGGCFDWVRPLLSNRRAAFVASAIGSQLVAVMFRARP